MVSLRCCSVVLMFVVFMVVRVCCSWCWVVVVCVIVLVIGWLVCIGCCGFGWSCGCCMLMLVMMRLCWVVLNVIGCGCCCVGLVWWLNVGWFWCSWFVSVGLWLSVCVLFCCGDGLV